MQKFFWPKSCFPEKKSEGESSLRYYEVNPEENSEDEEEIPLEEQLETLTAYLRLQHCYCVWCGAVFADQQELEQECPGPAAEFHDI